MLHLRNYWTVYSWQFAPWTRIKTGELDAVVVGTTVREGQIEILTISS
jgi:hypothetical protein